MFDGNFRAGKREVNLSGTNRRGRRDLLKNAEVQRKQRQEQLRREKAARLLQRVTRGHLSRVKIVGRFLPLASSQMTALSLCLSYRPFLTKFQTSRRDILLTFEKNQDNTTTIDMEVNAPSSLDYSQTSGSSNAQQMLSLELNETSWFSQRRIVENSLRELDGTAGSDGLFRLVEGFWQSTRVEENLFLALAMCLQTWCSTDPTNTITISLMQWAVEMCDKLPNTHCLALLATTVLSSPVYATSHEDFSKWFEALTDLLLLSNQPKTKLPPQNDFVSMLSGTDHKDRILEATLRNLQNGRQYRLLSNLLDLTKSPKLVLLIHYVLMQPQNDKLRVAVALMARGDTLDPCETAAAQDVVTSVDWNDFEDDEGDMEEEQVALDSHVKPSSSKKARGTAQLKRQELLTLIKIDKLYHDRIQQAAKKHTFDVATRNVATKIVKAPWVDWAISTLPNANDKRKQYMETLAILLQASSALRPRTKLTPLSSLAFNHSVLRRLWACTKEEKSDLFMIVFADLFSHYLVALSDQDFLRLHCTPHRHGVLDDSTVMAPDVVDCYRNVLHEAYWTKPVVSYDVEMDNLRGRLLLSGTKLWNALYERWDRLAKHTFCDESAWWFPHLSTRENGAVLPAREIDSSMEGRSDADESDDDDEMEANENGFPNELSAAEAESDALAGSFKDPKMARILTIIPQALPFDRRVKLFHSLLQADKRKTMQAAASRRAMMAMGGQEDNGMMWLDGSARESIKIRREKLYQDSMDQLNNMGSRLKHQVQVTFVNAHGTEEAGIDGGGVFKEFVDDLIKDGFAAKTDGESKGGAPQLFSVTPEGLLSVNLDLSQDGSMLTHYAFLGRVLSKAVYEGILVEPQFCLPFLNQLLGKVNSLEDLKNYDEEYYINLSKLRSFNESEISSLDLTFELTVGGSSPGSTPRVVELVRNGRTLPVTRGNVFQYTHAVANQLLNVQCAEQTRAFLDGFRGIIPVSWVRLFSANELQKLISGDDSIRGIDVLSLKRHMHYLGGYHESQPYIQAFWDVLQNDFSPEQQRKFLRFMTSCSRQPLLGFETLEPVPSIQQIRLRADEISPKSRLPTSQTCMNLLKLPNYQDRELLKEKLFAAIEAGAGFELT